MPDLPESSFGEPPERGSDRKRPSLRVSAATVAAIAGLLGALLAMATPFLPVKQTTAALNWPQSATYTDVDAPLMSQVPLTFHAVIPCSVLSGLKSGTQVIGTAPAQGDNAPINALFVRTTDTNVEVVNRNVVVVAAPIADISQCSQVTIDSTQEKTSASFAGLRDDDGNPLDGAMVGDFRPQVVGLYTDLTGRVASGFKVTSDVDSRFTTSPTLLKLSAIIGAALCTIIAIGALARLDMCDGRSHRRFFPAHWLRPTVADGLIGGTLIVWHFIGANTSDDGYILTMARVADKAGYMANYFRWFGVPEAPFGWYYYVLQWFSEISTASAWVRVPALVCGIGCWLLISREVIPRLGRTVRNDKVALYTAGLVFLAFWLPYDNGLRPEPVVAFGALLTWCSVERAIATGRLAPAAIACLVGAFTLAAAPTGLMCVAILLAGLRPILRVAARRYREHGKLALLAPIASAGFLILTVVYSDQTFAAIQEANGVRSAVGPNLPWTKDFLRYYYLILPTVDGSLSRRFAFLIMLLCAITCVVVLLRKRKVNGVSLGPSWRLIGAMFGTMFFMMFNPTKWTHHFGAYASIGGSLAALAAVLVAPYVLTVRRNRTLFLSGVLFILAFSFSSINGYWYVSSFGIPWWDKTVSLKGIQSGNVLLVLFGLSLLALLWQTMRADFTEPSKRLPGMKIASRLIGAPLTVAVAAVVAFEVLSMVKGAVWQYPAYSLARQNIESITSASCGMANDVLVEPNPNKGFLSPVADPKHPLKNANDPLAGSDPKGFTPDGVDTDLTAEETGVDPGSSGADSGFIGPKFARGQEAGTEGGELDKPGINGSHAKLPYGLNPGTTPVLGSFQKEMQQPASVETSWYSLPAPSADSPLIVITAAGRIYSVDSTGKATYGQQVLLDYGKRQADGTIKNLGQVRPLDIGPSPSWRNLRVPRSMIPAQADVVRIVANDPILADNQWVAFTPPRIPQLQTLNSLVGSKQPVLLDWAVGLQFPCQRPFDHVDGVAEVPNFRILPDHPLAVTGTTTWQAAENGGPLGFTNMIASRLAIPSYLMDDWGRDWGSLEKFNRYYPQAKTAKLETGEVTRSGFWNPGDIRVK
ncbi:arabinosyltransferase domain-containing protein [Smaragdicoccus niigatensis]|uniref:arabinosyltransferase domain-containing protein n=1 Tax=Smaragdicoccus niigatensis TaxID=359359 RepID=UPI000684ABD0